MGPHEYARMNGKMLIWQEWEERPSTEEKWNDYLVNLLNTPMPVEQYTARATVARKYYAEWREEEVRRKDYQKPRSLGFSIEPSKYPSHDMITHGKDESVPNNGLYFLSGTGRRHYTGAGDDSFAFEECRKAAVSAHPSGVASSPVYYPLFSSDIEWIKTEAMTDSDQYQPPGKLRVNYNAKDLDQPRMVGYWREICEIADSYPDVRYGISLMHVSNQIGKRKGHLSLLSFTIVIYKYEAWKRQQIYDSVNGKSKSSINNEQRRSKPSGQDNQSVRTDLDGREGSERGEIIRRESSQSEIATETRFRGDAVAIGRRPVDVRCVTTRTTFFYQEHPYCQGKGSVPYEWLK